MWILLDLDASKVSVGWEWSTNSSPVHLEIHSLRWSA